MMDYTKYCNYKDIVNEYNKLEIQKCSGCMQKRILREYNDLFNELTNSCISVKYNEETNAITILIINCVNDDKIQSYMFIIDKKYPFTSPKIYYNNKPYINLLKIPSVRFKDYLKLFTNKNCLCCHSLDCKYNWSPGITLKIIITDINKNRNYKKKIVIAILIDQLKEKFLIDDVDILTYL
jgi:ubiquitin-protein ligase